MGTSFLCLNGNRALLRTPAQAEAYSFYTPHLWHENITLMAFSSPNIVCKLSPLFIKMCSSTAHTIKLTYEFLTSISLGTCCSVILFPVHPTSHQLEPSHPEDYHLNQSCASYLFSPDIHLYSTPPPTLMPWSYCYSKLPFLK